MAGGLPILSCLCRQPVLSVMSCKLRYACCKARHEQSHLNQEPSDGVHCCAWAWWSCILVAEATSLS